MCKKIIFTFLLANCIVSAVLNVPTANAQAAAAKATPVTLQGGLTLYAPAGWTAQPPAATKVVLVNAANDSLIVGSLDSGEISLAGPELTNGFPMGMAYFCARRALQNRRVVYIAIHSLLPERPQKHLAW